MAKLLIRTENQSIEQDFPTGAHVRVGRTPQGTLRIHESSAQPETFTIAVPEGRISEEHLVLRCDAEDRWSVEDTQSRNGTFARLKPGTAYQLDAYSQISCAQVLTIETAEAASWQLPVESFKNTNDEEFAQFVYRRLREFVSKVEIVESSVAFEYDERVTRLPLRALNRRLHVHWRAQTRSVEAEQWLYGAVGLFNAEKSEAQAEEPWQFIAVTPGRVQALSLAKRFASWDVSILLRGQTGSGKDILANDLHDHSRRRSGPFVAINCAAIPSELFEAELFGWARGAHDKAFGERAGLIEHANRGTLFLDEIADLSLPNQSKLLRVLQERRVRRLGENKDRAVDVRIVAATHKDLEGLIASGAFREDLYFRLCGAQIMIPELGSADIAELAKEILQQVGKEHPPHVTDREAAVLIRLAAAHRWRGAGRELRAALARCLMLRRPGVSIEECWQTALAVGSQLPAVHKPQRSAAVIPDFDATESLATVSAIDKIIALNVIMKMVDDDPKARTAELASRFNLTYQGAAARLKRYGLELGRPDTKESIEEKLDAARKLLQPHMKWLREVLGF